MTGFASDHTSPFLACSCTCTVDFLLNTMHVTLPPFLVPCCTSAYCALPHRPPFCAVETVCRQSDRVAHLRVPPPRPRPVTAAGRLFSEAQNGVSYFLQFAGSLGLEDKSSANDFVTVGNRILRCSLVTRLIAGCAGALIVFAVTFSFLIQPS